MCMGNPLEIKKQNCLLKKLDKHGYIRVYKVVVKTERFFKPPIEHKPCKYKYGIQEAKNSYCCNWGWHGFTDLKSAEKWKEGVLDQDKYAGDIPEDEIILECLAKKEWIIKLGQDISFYGSFYLNTLTTKLLCFPKFPNTKVTVREFRKQLKEYEKDNGD